MSDQERFVHALEQVVGAAVPDLPAFILSVPRSYKRIGSPSANTLVFEITPHFVLKLTAFDREEKRAFFKHAQVAKQALIHAIQAKKNKDRPLLLYFIDAYESYSLEYDDVGMVLEKNMKGADMRTYFMDACKSTCMEDDVIHQLIGLVMVMIKIIHKLYKLGVNHNDLHDGNIFLIDAPCTVYLYKKSMFVSLPFTPVLFDFDWTHVVTPQSDIKQRAYEQYVTGSTPPCELRFISMGKQLALDVKTKCNFASRHVRYTYPNSKLSPSIDLSTFMMSAMTLLGKMKITSNSFVHTGLNYLIGMYNLCVNKDFNVSACMAEVHSMYRAYVTLLPATVRKTRESDRKSGNDTLPKRDSLQNMDMDMDTGGGRGLDQTQKLIMAKKSTKKAR